MRVQYKASYIFCFLRRFSYLGVLYNQFNTLLKFVKKVKGNSRRKCFQQPVVSVEDVFLKAFGYYCLFFHSFISFLKVFQSVVSLLSASLTASFNSCNCVASSSSRISFLSAYQATSSFTICKTFSSSMESISL